MSYMTNAKLEQHIRDGARALTPHEAEAVWSRPVEQASGDEWYLDGIAPQKQKKPSVPLIRALAAAAACLALCVLSLTLFARRPAATVYLDVNPGVQLQIDRQERVLRAAAENADGQLILEGMDLRRADLNTALNAILGSMVRHGYLTRGRSVVLLSVDSRDPQRAQSLSTRLSRELDGCLTSLVGSGAVLGQTIHDDDALEDLAEAYGISPGKAALLQKLVDAHPALDYTDLAALSMSDLARQLKDMGIDLGDYSDYRSAGWDDDDLNDLIDDLIDDLEDWADDRDDDAADDRDDDSLDNDRNDRDGRSDRDDEDDEDHDIDEDDEDNDLDVDDDDDRDERDDD
ncbi:MAG: hypothetical protein E7426_00195 [Ruminococcaceae bacterium]|nr:hypothetical protein [Oscillospiraceae bacterium]